jgi:hypothetical protein
MLYPPLYRTAYQLLGPDLKRISVSLLNFYLWKGNGFAFVSLTDSLLRVLRLFTYLITNLITYLLTPWSRVFLEKLTGSQVLKKFPAFYRTRRFITTFTSARYLSQS